MAPPAPHARKVARLRSESALSPLAGQRSSEARPAPFAQRRSPQPPASCRVAILTPDQSLRFCVSGERGAPLLPPPSNQPHPTPPPLPAVSRSPGHTRGHSLVRTTSSKPSADSTARKPEPPPWEQLTRVLSPHWTHVWGCCAGQKWCMVDYGAQEEMRVTLKEKKRTFTVLKRQAPDPGREKQTCRESFPAALGGQMLWTGSVTQIAFGHTPLKQLCPQRWRISSQS
ncbi:hypothetical protein E5288_WYG016872 [Bos mutus]|uniref:Uncharacterized protein n=1 Tax=Bos mutus TaxID=72004 RepID=A0A6B0RUN9_9CETA|nr:hypothetical protein [Bos mutus]